MAAAAGVRLGHRVWQADGSHTLRSNGTGKQKPGMELGMQLCLPQTFIRFILQTSLLLERNKLDAVEALSP